MITVITGGPGMGKTSLVVSMIMDDPHLQNRPIFTMGINDLLLEHIPCPPVKEWTEMRVSDEDETLMLPYFTFPPNAVVIVDEAQRVYRARGNGTKVPDHVAALETHRHGGIDFILMTQGPSLLDSNIKVLAGRHLHILKTKLGLRKIVEWPSIHNPQSSADINSGITKPFVLKKKAFSKYKSSEVHTKQTFAFPWPVLWLLVPIILIAYFGPRFYNRYFASKPQPVAESSPAPMPTGQGGAPAGATHGPGGQGAQSTPAAAVAPPVQVGSSYRSDAFIPTVYDHPESAPAYDGLRQVKSFPWPAACIATKSRCQCYSEQGTRVTISVEACREIVEGGRFNPYQEAPVLRSASPPPVLISSQERKNTKG
ncbi:zonular occludens toxin domain-containing protein [Chromobacterium haemolyticum]|uniref:zonular occludens toxin domain-containing protein n=1 Tax=Chromobacterium haemolyticum TaxID=394935 RepID=UPI0013167490|nr:zonular occludens toxin domain-containing protein [Chromobacterium haemolyticum]BBH12977.1 hypothetical protein CH06BL_22250 [Chromobacterium haemolyticum]